MAEYLIEDTTLTRIADAIRSKTGGTESLTLDQMEADIKGLPVLEAGITEFSQMKDLVTAYLAAADAAYTDDNGDSVSVIADYETAEGSYDRPLGYPLTATSGYICLQNEDSGNGWRMTVGTDADILSNIFNAIPNDVSQYLVKDTDGNMLENGRIKPTGKVRMVRFYGYIRNCRDLGGWACDGGTVKYGKLFRSGAVSSTETWIDPKIAKNIGIQHHIDFRSDAEASYITESCLGSRVRYQRIPIDLYYADSINAESADYENVKKVFRNIIDAAIHDEGVIYNCSLGRDRTGTVTFMLLALLGVARADIDKDYELTGFSAMDTPTYRTRTDYRAVATYLATLGGSTLRDNAVWWFVNAGFTIAEINAFRSAMVDGTPDELSAGDFATSYAITNTLTGCITSNDAVSVDVGDSYAAILSLADGYDTFSSVVVTMGGVDVTADVYSDGVINISSVTGDVVITAVATTTVVPSYTNQLDEAGYESGYRLSSSGTASAYEGSCLTGYIPCASGDVIRLKNITFQTGVTTGLTSANQRLAVYGADKALDVVANANDILNYPDKFNSVVDSDGVITEFIIPTTDAYANAAYIRLNCSYIGSDSIITVNEPIE